MKLFWCIALTFSRTKTPLTVTTWLKLCGWKRCLCPRKFEFIRDSIPGQGQAQHPPFSQCRYCVRLLKMEIFYNINTQFGIKFHDDYVFYYTDFIFFLMGVFYKSTFFGKTFDLGSIKESDSSVLWWQRGERMWIYNEGSVFSVITLEVIKQRRNFNELSCVRGFSTVWWNWACREGNLNLLRTSENNCSPFEV